MMWLMYFMAFSFIKYSTRHTPRTRANFSLCLVNSFTSVYAESFFSILFFTPPPLPKPFLYSLLFDFLPFGSRA